MASIKLRLSGFGHNLHPAVFYHLGAMFADLFIRIQPQKIPIRFVEVRDDSIGIRYQSPVVDAVENQAVCLKLFPEKIDIVSKDGFVLRRICCRWCHILSVSKKKHVSIKLHILTLYSSQIG